MEAKQVRSKLRKVVSNIGRLNDCDYKTVSNGVLKDCEEFHRSGKNPRWNQTKTKKITNLTEILKKCSSAISYNDPQTYYDNFYYPYKSAYNGVYYPSHLTNYVPYKQTYTQKPYGDPNVNVFGRRIIRLPRRKRKAKDTLQPRKLKRSNDEADDEPTAKRARVSFSPEDVVVLSGGRQDALFTNISDKELKTTEVYLSLDTSYSDTRVNAIAFVHESGSMGTVKLDMFNINEKDNVANKAFFYYCVGEISKKVSKGKYKYNSILTKASSYEEDFRKYELKNTWNKEEYEIKLNNKTLKNMEKILNNKLNDDDQ